MNKTETAKALTIASMVDNRRVTPETVEAWFPLLRDLDYDECVAAVQMHFRESDKYLLPAHVRENVKRIRRQREAEEARRPRAIEPLVVTLDREQLERETEKFTEFYRSLKSIGTMP